jgi:hypothetical protein
MSEENSTPQSARVRRIQQAQQIAASQEIDAPATVPNKAKRAPPIAADIWNEGEPVLKIDDLDLKDESLPVKLSLLMSINDFRRNQLARSLECLARQDWREFEVLVCDNGSSQDLESVFEKFRPYLRLKTKRLTRTEISVCPTQGLKSLMPMAEGDIWAIMQPEIMLLPKAARFIFEASSGERADNFSYQMGNGESSGRRWIVVKIFFLSAKTMEQIDAVDWHNNIEKIERDRGFFISAGGLITNTMALELDHFPWWFVGAAPATDPIWGDMPVFKGYATIDHWLMDYRRIKGYVDICSKGFMGLHQWHIKTTRTPKNETAMMIENFGIGP